MFRNKKGKFDFSALLFVPLAIGGTAFVLAMLYAFWWGANYVH